MPASGVDVRILGLDGKEVAHDGVSAGELWCARGPWITASYCDMDATDMGHRFTDDGCWRSGDMATMGARAYIKIVGRSKDVIKSGGEWIPSINMENALAAMPQVLEAAVIGVPHPKWQERPVTIFALAEPGSITADDVRAHLAQRFAKWQLPGAVLFVDAIARTSVGKANKRAMRAKYRDLYAVD